MRCQINKRKHVFLTYTTGHTAGLGFSKCNETPYFLSDTSTNLAGSNLTYNQF